MSARLIANTRSGGSLSTIPSEAGKPEILADENSEQAKAGLSAPVEVVHPNLPV